MWQHFCTHLVWATNLPPPIAHLGQLRLFKGIARFFPDIAIHAAFATAGNCPLLPFLH